MLTQWFPIEREKRHSATCLKTDTDSIRAIQMILTRPLNSVNDCILANIGGSRYFMEFAESRTFSDKNLCRVKNA